MKLNIHVAPIKRFIADMQYEDDTEDIAAVLATSYAMDSDIPLDKYLCVGFDDVTDGADMSAFSAEIAEKIRDFVLSLNDVTDLFFCCDRGESRSAALACAFMRYFGQDEMMIWSDSAYHPNILVYSLMSQALGLSCDADMSERLCAVSRKALQDSIEKARK